MEVIRIFKARAQRKPVRLRIARNAVDMDVEVRARHGPLTYWSLACSPVPHGAPAKSLTL
jgi:hypothetical protein